MLEESVNEFDKTIDDLAVELNNVFGNLNDVKWNLIIKSESFSRK